MWEIANLSILHEWLVLQYLLLLLDEPLLGLNADSLLQLGCYFRLEKNGGQEENPFLILIIVHVSKLHNKERNTFFSQCISRTKHLFPRGI